MTLDEAAAFHVVHCGTCADQSPAYSPLHGDMLALHRAVHELISGLAAPLTWLADRLLKAWRP